MPIDYVIDHRRRLVVSTGEGRLTFEEVVDHQTRLLSNPDFDPSYDQLIDLTAVSDFNLSAQQAAAVARRPIFSPSSRRALVALDPAIFGMGRLMEVYQEQHAEVQIFRDLASALPWLERQA